MKRDLENYIEEKIINLKSQNIHNDEIIKELEPLILKLNNARISYLFCCYFNNTNINAHEQIIIDSNSSEYLFKFARDVKNANIDKLEEKIIEIGNSSYIYSFAVEIKGANIRKLEKKLIEIGNVKFILNFMMEVKDANINELSIAIINSKDIGYIDTLILYISKFIQGKISPSVMELLQETVIAIGNVNLMIRLVNDIKNVDITKLEDKFIEMDNPENILRFITETDGVGIRKLGEKLIEIGDLKYIIMLVKKIEFKDITSKQKVIKIGSSEFMWQLAQELKGVNIKKLKEKILQSRNLEEICTYIISKTTNKKLLLKMIVNSNNNMLVNYACTRLEKLNEKNIYNDNKKEAVISNFKEILNLIDSNKVLKK